MASFEAIVNIYQTNLSQGMEVFVNNLVHKDQSSMEEEEEEKAEELSQAELNELATTTLANQLRGMDAQLFLIIQQVTHWTDKTHDGTPPKVIMLCCIPRL
jgi:uncharacterized protein YcbK (DUF882 family)